MRVARSGDFWGGLLLLAIAAVAYREGGDLPVAAGRGLGPGAVPKFAIAALAAFGTALVLRGVTTRPAGLGAWSLRGIVFVLGAIVFFAAGPTTLGLVPTVFVAALLAGFGAGDVRWREAVIVSAVLAAFCAALFVLLLRLPFPLWPVTWA